MATLLASCPCGFALDPSLDIGQYAHAAWTIRDGFFKSPIHAIAQTPDGYLWFGTENGLLRFDGIRTVSWQPPAGEHLPSNNIVTLLVTRDGRLWIGSAAGLASWKEGTLVHYPELAGQMLEALLEDRGGTVWAGMIAVPHARLCSIQSVSIRCYGQDGSLGRGVLSLFEGNGNLWVGAQTGLWRWKPGPPKHYAIPMQALNVYELSVYALNKLDNGPLLIALPGGIRQLVGDRAEAYPIRADTHRSTGCFGIGMAACGLEPWREDFCIYTREERICLLG